jgi:DNA-binding NarL/FixJ family response regulator/anti-sigma regulatory factor (Ser/Thr protein kinase)
MGRVLVIRGESELIEALRNELGNQGHEIDSCGGSVEAIQHVRHHAVDVVLTDPSTGVPEDLALAEELRHTRPGIRVILRAPEARRDEVIGALRARVFACFTPSSTVHEVVEMVRSALADNVADDDIEVVSGLPYWLTLRVSCRLLTADRLVRFLTEFEETVPEPDRDLLMTAFREMLLNAMEHGGGFDSEKVVEVTAARTARAIVYHFQDPGMGFSGSTAQLAAAGCPDDIMTTALKRAELGMRPGGLGVLIARQIVDELVYNERGNEVLLIKHLTPRS